MQNSELELADGLTLVVLPDAGSDDDTEDEDMNESEDDGMNGKISKIVSKLQSSHEEEDTAVDP